LRFQNQGKQTERPAGLGPLIFILDSLYKDFPSLFSSDPFIISSSFIRIDRTGSSIEPAPPWKELSKTRSKPG
jgi:hypothetical protein